MPRRMRGISPVIATVIILAVTIAIAIAVVGWVMGLFRSSSKGSVQLIVMPDSYIDANSGNVSIHLKNKGSVTAEVVKITIGGANCTWTGDVKIPPGQETTISTTCSSVTPGVTYDVYVYTADGSVFPGQVVAQ